MAEKVISNENKKYNAFENMFYLIKGIWKKDKWLFFIIVIQIPATVIIPLLSIYLPKVIIDSVINKTDISNFLFKVFPIIIGIVVSTFIITASKQILEGSGSMYRVGYINDIGMKSIDTDFENVDGPKGQTKIMKAIMAVNDDSSPAQAIVNLSIEFFSNIIGFILYAGIISTLHPLIVFFILISSIVNYLVGVYVNKYEHKNKDNLTPIEKKLRYITQKTGDFKSAKDMRLYNMTDWFQNMYGIF